MTYTEPEETASRVEQPLPAKAVGSVPATLPNAAEGRKCCADEAGLVMPDAATFAGMGLDRNADKASGRLPIPALVAQLAELQVRRKFWIGNVNKQTNAVKALVRLGLGWRYDEEEDDREKVNARAARIVSAALTGKEQKPEDEAVFDRLGGDLLKVAAALEPCQTARHQIELDMKRAVRKLPVYQWAKDVKGFGELGLAVVIAEAGDLSGYPKKGHLWRRLGLAPFEGRAYSTWRMKGGLTAEDWTEAGYSPRRRAEVYAVISEPLMKHQLISEAKSGLRFGCANGPYGGVYVRRREHLEVAHPDWTPKHCQMDAMRVMTKYLLRDLWQEWRRVGNSVP